MVTQEDNKIAEAVIVSGASSGIGEAIARKLLSMGYKVYGIARDFTSCAIESANFCEVEIDLGHGESLPDKLLSLQDRISENIVAIVNNAGIGRMGYLEQLSYTQIRELIDINFLAHVYMVKAFLPQMKESAQPGKHRDLIFIGSEAALKGGQQGSIYCASKFAIRGFVQSLREECAKSYVRVSLINPGMVKSPFFDELNFQPGEDEENYIEPDDIANVVEIILRTRTGTVFDEINLSPLKKVVRKK